MTVFKTIRLAFVMSLAAIFNIAEAQHSVLASGNWFKFSVEKDGVFRINFELLKKVGIDPSRIDPRTLKIYGNGGGMLPQANNTPRIADLAENAIYVSGEDDSKFDKQDFILFYAEGPDKHAYDTRRNIHYYENNLYSDKNYYFLTFGEAYGKRIGTDEDLDIPAPVIDTFNEFTYYEKDEINILHSGREWFGDFFASNTLERSFSIPVSNMAGGAPIRVVSDVMGQSYTDASFRLYLNNIEIGKQNIPLIPNYPYSDKGFHKRDTLTVNTTDVGAPGRNSHDLTYRFTKGTGSSTAYLDFFLLSYERHLALYNNQTIFLSGKSVDNSVSQFVVTSVTDQCMIWNITDPFNCKLQSYTTSNQTAKFSTPTTPLKKFIVFNDNTEAPAFTGKVENQNLRGLNTPNLIIVTHPSLAAEAQRLAAHRQASGNWSVEVVTTDQVFNEFSSGRQDVSAIRDFTKYLYDKSPSTLKALLLFGKGSYDYKDRIQKNTNFVITYESRHSLHELYTYSSDDYFGFLEAGEGTWAEDISQNHTLDIGVGRLPVSTAEEANHVVTKIIDYDTNQKALGYWRKQVVFVADDGNTDDGFTRLHQFQANQLAEYIESQQAGIDTRKLFMGSYTRTGTGTFPRLTEDVVRAFDRGALIINYTGHGNEKQWADEDFFNNNTIAGLDNKLYAFMVTATCEFGRHDDPSTISGAEHCVTQANGGAVGLVTTARPVNATTNFNLNQAFYEALFQRNGNAYLPIGEVFRRTKNNSVSGVSNRNFSLLADPSMTLALAPNTIAVTSLKTASGSDVLKALSTVIAKGEIKDAGGQKLTSFNGILEATLFDKETKYVTSGRNNPQLEYSQWSNALFRGKATVTNGEFELRFIIPKNIAYQVAAGKFSLYASDPVLKQDASGSTEDIMVGDSEPDPPDDSAAPQMRLFMGDTTFINGGVTTPDTYLLVNLSDNTAINISNYGIGNSVIAVLDNDVETYVLNDYYVADTDNYSAGWIKFPLRGLTPGRHTLTVKAWDVYNNNVSGSIDFVVTDGETLVIEKFGNYPNPFRENTTLYFTHNRSGDDLQAQVFIYTLAGEVVKSIEITLPASDYKVNLMEFYSPDDLGKKLSAGLYFARLIVRSLTNGSKNEQVTKLIILN